MSRLKTNEKQTLLRHTFKAFRKTTRYERMSRTLNNAKNSYELFLIDIKLLLLGNEFDSISFFV